MGEWTVVNWDQLISTTISLCSENESFN